MEKEVYGLGEKIEEESQTIQWHGHSFNVEGVGRELRIMEVTEETELTQLPAEVWQGIILLDEKLRFKRRDRLEYLVLDTGDSVSYLRIEEREGRLFIFKGEKTEEEFGPKYEAQNDSFTQVSLPEKVRVYYNSENGDFRIFGGTKRGK